MIEEKQSDTIEDFEGWDSPADVDFFGSGPDTSVEEIVDIVEKEDLTIEKEEKKTEDPLPEEIDLFEEETEVLKEEDEDGEVSTPEKKKKPVSISSKNTLEFLKEKGLVDFELGEGQELSDDIAEDLLESSFEEGVETRFLDSISSLSDITKEFVKYDKEGGNVRDLITQLASQSVSGITKDTDMTQEINQEAVVKSALKEQGHDDEYITSNLEFLKDSGRLESTSKVLFDKKIATQDQTAATLAEKQKGKRLEAQKKQKEYKQSVASLLSEKKEVSGFKFTPKEKRELPSYISDSTVKLENGSSVSNMQKDLYDALQDKEKTLIIAKLLKSNFDTSSLTKEAKTKVTEAVKNDLQHSKQTPRAANSSSQTKKDLADLL